MSKILVNDLGRDNITVNVIAPGLFPTDMSKVSAMLDYSDFLS
jgi:NAD(P)-dependent dehydrogenase (short-subunit alcohol dehydrogenase family)